MSENSKLRRDGTRRSARGEPSVSVSSHAPKVRGKVTFGNVTIAGSRPSADVVQKNVDLSTDALQRITVKLVKPGVTLPKKKGVPRFSVDENDPSIIIRVLDGKTDRGRLINGVFEIIG